MKLSSRKIRIFITIFSNLTLRFVIALCGFIITPLIISHYGSAINGMVSSITQFISYLNLVEAGIGGATIAALYLPLSNKDFNSINSILSSTKHFYIKSGILFTTMIIILSIVYPFIISYEIDIFTSFFMVLILGITGTAEFFLIGKYRVLLTADKKTYVLSFIQIFAILIRTVICFFMIKFDLNILIVKLIYSLTFLSRYFVIKIYIKRKYKWINFNYIKNNKAISQSKNVLVHEIAGMIVYNSPIIILTFCCNLKEVSIYAVYAMVFNAIKSFITAFGNGMQSFFGESLIIESLNKTKNFFSKYQTLFFSILGWFYTMSYILIIPFMKIYTKNMTDANYLQPKLALFFVIVGILNALRSPEAQLISASGHFKQTQARAIIEAVINLVVSIICTIKFGFMGVLIGQIVSGIYRTIDMIVYTSNKILHSHFYSTFIKISIYFFIYFILYIFIKNININPKSYFEWIKIASLLGIYFIIPVFVTFIFQFYNKKKTRKNNAKKN